MQWIANRKICPCIAFCRCRARLTAPPRRVFSRRWHHRMGAQLRSGVRRPTQASVSFSAGSGDHHSERCTHSSRRAPTCGRRRRCPFPGGTTDAIAEWQICSTSQGSSCNPMVSSPLICPFSIPLPRQVTGAYSISDGTHLKMAYSPMTIRLWIGSQLCTQGERYHKGATTDLGCLTMFNTANNSVTMIDVV